MNYEMPEINLLDELPKILLLAIVWANKISSHILAIGSPLSEEYNEIAKNAGVKSPELIRIHEVEKLPEPDNPILWTAANQVGFFNPSMVAMTLGYSITICNGHMNNTLMSHELRHVYQYETFGSIDAFLREYLWQIVTRGYMNSPL